MRGRVVRDDAQHRLHRVAAIGRDADVDCLAERLLDHRDAGLIAIIGRASKLRKVDELEVGRARRCRVVLRACPDRVALRARRGRVALHA